MRPDLSAEQQQERTLLPENCGGADVELLPKTTCGRVRNCQAQ